LRDGALQNGLDLRAMGVPDRADYDLDALLDDLADAAEAAFKRMGKRERRDEAAVEEVLRQAVRREAARIWGKKPAVDAIVMAG
jgi:ribonuclease J